MPSQTPLQKITACCIALAIALTPTAGAFADTIPDDLAQDFTAYTDTFIISAYYSPIPNQSVYYRGSYDADVRLNGNGVHGASGKDVFPGMLAAPKKYPFGIKIKIPGLGVGEVSDRGGAIVPAGQRGYGHDRLDVWMGSGEEGLARALAWGKRTVSVTVYSKASTIATSFTLPSDTSVLAHLPRAVATVQTGSTGDDVTSIQQQLATYGYYHGDISGTYDDATQKAVIAFQVDKGVIDTPSDSDAGIVGPRTRAALAGGAVKPATLLASNILTSGGNGTSADARFPVTLSTGDRGDRVQELQQALAQLGVGDCDINALYDDATAHCVFIFQQQQKLVGSMNDAGAGIFGPLTRTALAAALAADDTQKNTRIAAYIPTGNPNAGDAGDDVARLQKGLNVLGYAQNLTTGTYDDATRAAVLALQIDTKLIGDARDFGAGHFGQKTKAAYTAALRAKLLALPPVADAPAWHRPIAQYYTPKFTQDLSIGDTGAQVSQLQQTLGKLGYDTPVSGNFDTDTADSLATFQVDAGILSSKQDTGAGVLGPQTRDALNAASAREKVALVVGES